MPSSPVHIKIAYMMSEELGIENVSDFILGAISPDCVNYGQEQASQEVRYTAHIRDFDYDVWKKNLKSFYSENKEKFKDNIDFLKGYIFHSFCDIAWDEVVQPELFEFLGTLGYGYDDMTAQKWQELYRFNGVIVREDDYKKAVNLLKKGRAEEIAGCSKELIIKYRDYVADDYKDKIKDEKPLYLGEKQINQTIEQMRKMNYIEFV